MDLPVPSGFDLQEDTSPAAWIERGVKPWGQDRVRLWSFLPSAFERYARVFHPAVQGPEGRGTTRWSELAARRGVSLRPDIGFREVSGVDPKDQTRWSEVEPREGLDRDQVVSLAGILEPFTTTPDRCWLAAWDGWGSWGPGSSATLTAVKDVPRSLFRRRTTPSRRARRDMDRAATDLRRTLDALPKVVIPHRAYFLFATRVDRVADFEIGGWYQWPNYWWPRDVAWCVATELDGYSTFVGGSADCISSLVASPLVEAIEVPEDVPMDPGPY